MLHYCFTAIKTYFCANIEFYPIKIPIVGGLSCKYSWVIEILLLYWMLQSLVVHSKITLEAPTLTRSVNEHATNWKDTDLSYSTYLNILDFFYELILLAHSLSVQYARISECSCISNLAIWPIHQSTLNIFIVKFRFSILFTYSFLLKSETSSPIYESRHNLFYMYNLTLSCYVGPHHLAWVR